jgi:WD40 repeat protein
MLNRCRSLGVLVCAVVTLGQPVRGEEPQAGAIAPSSRRASVHADDYGDPLPAGAIARLGTIRLRHALHEGSGAACLAFSPDSKTLVSGGDVGVLAWDVATGKELPWSHERTPVTSARFSLDGEVFITADNTGSLCYRDVKTGWILRRKVRPRDDRAPSGYESFFSQNGKVIGATGFDYQMQLWDVDSGKLIFQVKRGTERWFYPAVLSLEGKTLVIGGEGSRLQVIDAATGQVFRELQRPSNAPPPKRNSQQLTEGIFGFAFSADGKLVTGSGYKSVYVWDVSRGDLYRKIKGVNGTLAFSPDGKYLACAMSSAMALVDVAAGKEVRRFEHAPYYARAITFSPDGRIVAAAEDHAIKLWDVATGRRLHDFPGHESEVVKLAFSPDGSTLSSGDLGEGKLIVWDLKTRRPRHVFWHEFPSVQAIAYSPDS